MSQEKPHKWVKHHILIQNLKALSLLVLSIICCPTFTFPSNARILTHTCDNRKNEGFWWGKTLADLFFFVIQNPPNFEEFKNCIGRWFCRVWINSSISIYVVKIKNILVINIHLLLSSKTLNYFKRFFYLFLLHSSCQNLLFSSASNSQIKLSNNWKLEKSNSHGWKIETLNYTIFF